MSVRVELVPSGGLRYVRVREDVAGRARHVASFGRADDPDAIRRARVFVAIVHVHRAAAALREAVS